MPQKICTAAGANVARRNEEKAIAHGLGHVMGKLNDPLVSITDPAGTEIAWSSTGGVGFKASRTSALQASARLRRAGG